MRITSRWTPLVLAALLPLAACGPEDTDTEADPLEEPAPTEMPGETDRDMMEPTSITLDTKNESGVTGQATATHHADSVTVEVNIMGAAEDGEYPAHVHTGTCDEAGSVVAPLNSLQVSGGSGMSTSEIMASDVPEDEDAIIQVHDPSGQPIACGDMTGHGDMGGMDGMDEGGMEGGGS